MKKYILTIRTGVLALVLLIVSSCDDWMDDNINPNAVLSAPPSQMLASAVGTFGFVAGGSDLFRYSAIWSQQITAQAGRQTENYSKYNLSDTEVNGVWRTNLYGAILMDLEQLLKSDPVTTHPHYFGMAKVLKAFTYTYLVDFWGDVPFSEALQGASNVQPAIDDDAVIYPQLLTLLDEAIIDLKATSASLTGPGNNDYIFTGNASKWIRTANVLKLRIYLKLANTPGFNTADIATFITNTPATEFMTANSDDFQHPFVASLSGRQNPTHQFILSRTDDICTSSTLINLMNGKADPRRVNYFTPAPFSPAAYSTPPTGTTGYVGLQPGFGGGIVNNTLSRLHRFVRGAVTTTTIPAGPNLTVTGSSSLSYDGGAPSNILT
ncbi:MAG TPA: SusD/RagB family nutrient-binding outer membrane lipoprotein, partial [Cyclobacteriaceae bacterium]|nr:SusD/RagB family nutrient-binding outer membrane lipoprotein [Cyclobacteriaceae bacterium]